MAPRILVVDDERSIRIFIEAMLAKEDYVVEVAASGEEALSRLRENVYDLLLVDLKLGGIDGLSILAECKQLHPGSGVIVLTGHGALDSAIQALRLGASDYLLKPCSDEELKSSVKRVLAQTWQEARTKDLVSKVVSWVRESAAAPHQHSFSVDVEVGAEPTHRGTNPTDAPDPIIRVGEFIFDRARHVVTLNGNLLCLTPTEYRLLTCLADSADCPLSCQQIVRQVYDYDCHEDDARQLIKLHVKNLRRKVEIDPANPQRILNVRGVGYLLSSTLGHQEPIR